MFEYIQDNLKRVHDNIGNCAIKSGRKPEDITLICVTKTVEPERILKAAEFGENNFGENRVQELKGKQPVITGEVNWHLIGHLQTNKVKYVVGKVALIHSVDSLNLAQEIDKAAAKKNCIQEILVEINIAQEQSKFGLSTAKAPEFIGQLLQLNNIRVVGLMTVAPYADNGENNRNYFQTLRQLNVDIDRRFGDNINMSLLSMGMSGDYEAAIKEGANLVRIGTGIFGQR